jgi:hypothetical protein
MKASRGGEFFKAANCAGPSYPARSFGVGARGFKIILSVFLLEILLATQVFAGPPYLTDDPEPTDYGHWENYVFGQGDHTVRGYSIIGPAVEINYGGFPDTQLSATIPVVSGRGDAPAATGFGDILLGVKYRFIHETNGWPQIALYPAITLPTGNPSHGLGNGRPMYQLPVWAQKSWGPWTTYGGGGAWFNSVPGRRNYGFGGWLVQRDFGEHITLGPEIYAQGRDADDDRGFIAPNFGGTYKFNEHWSLLGSVGHSVVGQTHMLWYFALGINF